MGAIMRARYVTSFRHWRTATYTITPTLTEGQTTALQGTLYSAFHVGEQVLIHIMHLSTAAATIQAYIRICWTSLPDFNHVILCVPLEESDTAGESASLINSLVTLAVWQ